ncbi:hypothetical protein GIB67_011330 [Kingdonia uniflora]|uniref:Uncharacterized protein n=1 Tax=Kingdonia uniflora TaxID=39325 RepID=A0A7J7MNL0_9MAGN|nr:hypothetical protein GIB67_011330 [Kingdonia uniflora]
MSNPEGTIVFTTIGRPYYGFDIFSISLPSTLNDSTFQTLTERCLTDGISVNFNAQFLDEYESIVYVSERSGSDRIYKNQSGNPRQLQQLPHIPESLFHDRPVLNNGYLYFVSAHEPADKPFKSWSAVYSTRIEDPKPVRVTPYGAVDYSPAVSRTGRFVAVASNGFRPWKGEFHELNTDIVVFDSSDPTQRVVVCEHGGWPTWSGDSIIYFHRQSDDGWWSVYRVNLPKHFNVSDKPGMPRRITPPGLHAFTPAASHDGKYVAMATRRGGQMFRHIELFDLELETFYNMTMALNPNFHHYNPFVSPESGFIGYHRFRGELGQGELTIPHLDQVVSSVKELRMIRLNGSFPSVSPDGNFIAFNHDFEGNSGVKIVRSDGSKRWTVMKDRVSFYTSWSRTDGGVIYSSVGPIFGSPRATVQIARISFDPKHLDNDRDEVLADVKILTRDDTGNNAFPTCSPDGKHLLFRSGRSGHKNLYIVNAMNGEFDGGIRQLTDGPWIDTMPNWSPNGELIVFSSNRHDPNNAEVFGIYIIRPDGTDLRRVIVASAEEHRERINHVCFSPDSKWLLFATNIGGVSADPVSMPNQFQPYGDLYIAKLDGSGLRRLTWNGYENGTPTWCKTVENYVRSISLGNGNVRDKLTGQFEEPKWITCDI